MLTATEKGRKLHITIGDPSEPDAITLEVAPVDVETGALLLAHFLNIHVGVAADAITAAEDMALVALGEENFKTAQTLRPEEFRGAVQCAFFWNTQGGGTEALQTYLSDGLPKAVEVVFEAAGVQPTPPSKTSPSSESENPTP
ncbi:hypothetical protein G3H63_15545 [Microbacterium resistens]|uniref:hypothetical protein n=1 Tax=Microbacterium resistens TaxID=156977 RepID=UPI001C5870E6|nr:hypothetical protein [Microbacterium resistens]MBW1640478.1 hypothetical protein [Microbacterium resistens]